jgi:hypothetical protein
MSIGFAPQFPPNVCRDRAQEADGTPSILLRAAKGVFISAKDLLLVVGA